MLLRRLLLASLFGFLLVACADGGNDTADVPAPTQAESTNDLQALFWSNLQQHCGNAYAGGLTLEPEGDEMLTGTEALVVHFRECGADTLKLPFHIELEEEETWDRSRTWVFMQADDGLELRHDHRLQDGSPDEGNTWYGGYTEEAGTANQQEFLYAERRAEDGSRLGWRIVIVPQERYTYGTIRGEEWTWRVDFDLTEPVSPPPAPWGHEEREAG